MKLRAVLFDMDDTLIDRRATMRKYAGVFLESFGSRLDKIDEEGLFSAIHKADGGGYRGMEKFHELVEVLPWVDRPEAEELHKHWEVQFGKSATPFEGMFELLNALKAQGYKLGLITNGGTERQNEKVDVLGIRDYFDSLIVSDTVGLRKPDPRIFHLALEQIGVGAAEACYVGDHPINDVIGSEQAGLIPLWRKGIHDWPVEHPQPKYQFTALAEVLPLIQRIEQG